MSPAWKEKAASFTGESKIAWYILKVATYVTELNSFPPSLL